MALPFVRGKAALVTGGGSGIGWEFTKRLLSEGVKVMIADLRLDKDAIHRINNRVGAEVLVFQETDMTDWSHLRRPFNNAVEIFGSLDIVVACAGIFEPTQSNFWHLRDSVDTVATNQFRILAVNLSHPIRATQLAIDNFKRLNHGGVVVVVSSIAAQMELLPCPLYAASKAGINSFVHSMGALEGYNGIRVVAVAPGVVRTPIWTEDKLHWVDHHQDEWVPIQRVTQTMFELITGEDNVGGTILDKFSFPFN